LVYEELAEALHTANLALVDARAQLTLAHKRVNTIQETCHTHFSALQEHISKFLED
jgi:hypothetical protein